MSSAAGAPATKETILAVTDDDVVWCYRTLLGRGPESPETVRSLSGSAKDFRSLVLLFLRSPEYQIKNLRSALIPLAEGEMHVDVAASKEEMLRLQERIRPSH